MQSFLFRPTRDDERFVVFSRNWLMRFGIGASAGETLLVS
jgi:hypothetical protein